MKRLFLSLILLFTLTKAWSQYVSPFVTATSGGATESTSLQLQWTLGEAGVLLLSGPSAQLTCGFHQTDEFCFGDFNFDGTINTIDILILLGEWECTGACVADMDESGDVGTTDVLLLLGTFGTSCYIDL